MARPIILILMHARTTLADLRTWAVTQLAEEWREDGLDVKVAFGPKEAVPADVLFLHVDLSVVPDEYLALATRYRASVNGRVKDIRKSTFSTNLVQPADGWTGPCIVKSEFNCAGNAEWAYHGRGANLEAAPPKFPFPIKHQLDYRVYPSPSQVPKSFFSDPSLVVERFLPEMEDGLFHTRSYHFLGRAGSAVRLGSPHPIVLGRTQTRLEVVQPPPELQTIREALGLDYGKIDYLQHGDKTIIIDLNKTTGGGGLGQDPRIHTMRSERARGIRDFLS